ncbi:hypothetical protein DP113_33135 (plasmid) [Brasilonema octagenarum UFV-E1]|uniref:Transposase n=1 Tax=Brasilonema octagenarum UFV-OR1 TaxID=417115 RepID=A0ABX1MBY5_9CYAN|nr:hypothetical protein [Brasilonema octagenarum UFV-OR1]QDL18983.1 hypothetical protein DP113_33135 [Brasilonema octagenarum UFV-E1]
MTGHYEIKMKFWLLNKTYLFIHIVEAVSNQLNNYQCQGFFYETINQLLLHKTYLQLSLT